jgi:hypothetical protein
METKVLFADGFEDAFIGIGESFGGSLRACYSLEKVINILMEMGMTKEEAFEYYEYNIVGAYIEENMPIFVDNISYNDFIEQYEEE